jgi:hypothetical protein
MFCAEMAASTVTTPALPEKVALAPGALLHGRKTVPLNQELSVVFQLPLPPLGEPRGDQVELAWAFAV